MEQESKKKERKNISNLPEERLNLLKQNKKDLDAEIPGFSPVKAGKGGNKRNFFAAWDDMEQHEIDFTTE